MNPRLLKGVLCAGIALILLFVLATLNGLFGILDGSFGFADATYADAPPSESPTPYASLAESPHPYPNSYIDTWTISQPGVSEMRLHFTKVEIVKGDDLFLLDRNRLLLLNYGQYLPGGEDFWTEWYATDTIFLRLDTNTSSTAYGFLVDQMETRIGPAPSTSYLAESYHPYANNCTYTWTISQPGVSQMRLHFTRWELAPRSDSLSLLNKSGFLLTRYNKSHLPNGSNAWTEWYGGDTVRLVLETDGTDSAWGFLVDIGEAKRSDGTSFDFTLSVEVKEGGGGGTSWPWVIAVILGALAVFFAALAAIRWRRS